MDAYSHYFIYIMIRYFTMQENNEMKYCNRGLTSARQIRHTSNNFHFVRRLFAKYCRGVIFRYIFPVLIIFVHIQYTHVHKVVGNSRCWLR